MSVHNTFFSHITACLPSFSLPNFITNLFKKITQFLFNCEEPKPLKERAVSPTNPLSPVEEKTEDIAQKKFNPDLCVSKFTPEMWDISNRSVMSLPVDADLQVNEQNVPEEDRAEFNRLTQRVIKPDRKAGIRFEKLRDDLKVFLEKMDKSSLDTFTNYLRELITKMRMGTISSHELMLEVRIIRQVLFNRSVYFQTECGIDRGGLPDLVLGPIFSQLFPDRDIQAYDNPYSADESFFYLKDKWVAGLIIGEHGHAVAYIYTPEGYVKLDNNRIFKNTFTPQEVLETVKVNGNINCKVLTLPKGEMPKTFPNPRKWTLPEWERNNCFMATSLIYLLLHDHYQNNS